MNEQKNDMQSFKMSKPNGNILVRLISLILSIGVVLLAFMFVPVFMMAGYAGPIWGWVIVATWIAIIVTTAISVALIVKMKIKGIVMFSIVALFFIIVYFMIPEFRRNIDLETLWLPISLIIMVSILWVSRKQFN